MPRAEKPLRGPLKWQREGAASATPLKPLFLFSGPFDKVNRPEQPAGACSRADEDEKEAAVTHWATLLRKADRRPMR